MVVGVRHISYEQNGRVVIVTIRWPEVMNALHFEASLELGEAWCRYESDDEAWVAIVTGAGDKAFFAGADLKRLSSYSQEQIAAELEAGSTTCPTRSSMHRNSWIVITPGAARAPVDERRRREDAPRRSRLRSAALDARRAARISSHLSVV